MLDASIPVFVLFQEPLFCVSAGLILSVATVKLLISDICTNSTVCSFLCLCKVKDNGPKLTTIPSSLFLTHTHYSLTHKVGVNNKNKHAHTNVVESTFSHAHTAPPTLSIVLLQSRFLYNGHSHTYKHAVITDPAFRLSTET